VQPGLELWLIVVLADCAGLQTETLEQGASLGMQIEQEAYTLTPVRKDLSSQVWMIIITIDWEQHLVQALLQVKVYMSQTAASHCASLGNIEPRTSLSLYNNRHSSSSSARGG
jgi:hypothetical protein